MAGPDPTEAAISEQEAHERLALDSRAQAASQAAARRYLWRYFLGYGVAAALWLLVVAGAARWSYGGSLGRAIVSGTAVGLLMSVALLPARAVPVRAGLSRRVRVAMVVGGAVVFALPASVAARYPLAAVAGAVLVLGYWAAWARWCTRA
jgi:hypothetical protein